MAVVSSIAPSSFEEMLSKFDSSMEIDTEFHLPSSLKSDEQLQFQGFSGIQRYSARTSDRGGATSPAPSSNASVPALSMSGSTPGETSPNPSLVLSSGVTQSPLPISSEQEESQIISPLVEPSNGWARQASHISSLNRVSSQRASIYASSAQSGSFSSRSQQAFLNLVPEGLAGDSYLDTNASGPLRVVNGPDDPPSPSEYSVHDHPPDHPSATEYSVHDYPQEPPDVNNPNSICSVRRTNAKTRRKESQSTLNSASRRFSFEASPESEVLTLGDQSSNSNIGSRAPRRKFSFELPSESAPPTSGEQSSADQSQMKPDEDRWIDVKEGTREWEVYWQQEKYRRSTLGVSPEGLPNQSTAQSNFSEVSKKSRNRGYQRGYDILRSGFSRQDASESYGLVSGSHLSVEAEKARQDAYSTLDKLSMEARSQKVPRRNWGPRYRDEK